MVVIDTFPANDIEEYPEWEAAVWIETCLYDRTWEIDMEVFSDLDPRAEAEL